MSDINEIGATAFVIASIRALEDEKPEPLFSDPYAEWFSNERARGAARQLDIAFPVPSIYSSASPMGRKSALRREIPWILR